MFEFLKRFTKPVPIKIIGFLNPEVTFTTEAEVELGTLNVIAEVEGERIRARLNVKELSAESYTGDLVAPVEAVPFLKEIFKPYHEKRVDPRLRRNLRVLSKDLPGFKGTSRDLSYHGARLEIGGPLPIGTPLSLAIDLDDAAGTCIEVTGVTRWCAPKENTPYSLIGVEFDELDSKSEHALTAFLKILEDSEKGNLKLG